MAKDKLIKPKVPGRNIIRGLLKLQRGRCALTNVKLDPNNVSADHIIPMSLTEDKENPNYGKFWLVSSNVNKMKSNLTLDEFYKTAELLIKNKDNANNLKNKIFNNQIEEIEKKDFDKYILDNYDENGVIKD